MRELGRSLLLAAGLAVATATVAQAADMAFELVKTGSGRWIAAAGEITEQTPDRFRRFLEDNRLDDPNAGTLVYLDSPGGNLTAGIKLGGLIRKYGLHTAIGKSLPAHGRDMVIRPGECASACAFAFLGGAVRAAKGGELGVHQFYDAQAINDPDRSFSSEDMSTQQLLGAIIVNFVVRMGVDPRVASIAASTMPEDMYFFTDEELDDLRINFDPRRFGAWDIGLDGRGVVARSRSEDGVREVSLYCDARDGRTRVRLGGLGDGTDRVLSAIRDAGALSVFGERVAARDVGAFGREAARGIEAVVGGISAETVGSLGDLVIEAARGAAGAAAIPDVVTPSDNAAEAFAIALRNCV
ncbi:MAG TPA: hypothetical protein PKA74_06670 [Bauldia sp.]|nr:hypothetical protein [Bauldia sp.]